MGFLNHDNVAIVQIDPLDYEDHHPQPAKICWLIEVADRTLRRDRDLKAPAYSRARISEFWMCRNTVCLCCDHRDRMATELNKRYRNTMKLPRWRFQIA